MSSWTCQNESETRQLGASWAPELKDGDLIALVGTLGMGKTRLVQGIAKGLGHEGEVTSPTFGLVHEYDTGRLPLYHFDWYRLDSPDELERIAWDDYLDLEGVIVVEWADRFPDMLPDSTRWIRVTAPGEEGSTRLVEEFQN